MILLKIIFVLPLLFQTLLRRSGGTCLSCNSETLLNINSSGRTRIKVASILLSVQEDWTYFAPSGPHLQFSFLLYFTLTGIHGASLSDLGGSVFVKINYLGLIVPFGATLL